MGDLNLRLECNWPNYLLVILLKKMVMHNLPLHFQTFKTLLETEYTKLKYSIHFLKEIAIIAYGTIGWFHLSSIIFYGNLSTDWSHTQAAPKKKKKLRDKCSLLLTTSCVMFEIYSFWLFLSKMVVQKRNCEREIHWTDILVCTHFLAEPLLTCHRRHFCVTCTLICIGLLTIDYVIP